MAQGYTRGQIAKMVGIGLEAVRYYEKEGLLKPQRTDNGYRFYTDDDYRTLVDIVAFREGGFSIEDIQHLLHGNSRDENRALFRTHVQREKEQVKRHRLLLHLFENAEQSYIKVERCFGKWEEAPFPRMFPMGTDGLTSHRDCAECTYMLDSFTGLPDSPRQEISELGLFETDTRALGVLSEWKNERSIAYEHCAHTVVLSPTRKLSQEDAVRTAQDAIAAGYHLTGELLGFYIVASSEGFFVDTYLPLAMGDA